MSGVAACLQSNVGKDGSRVLDLERSLKAGKTTMYPAYPQGKWICPLCKANAGWSDLVIDETLATVLAAIDPTAKTVSVSCHVAGTAGADAASAHSGGPGLAGVVDLNSGLAREVGSQSVRGGLELHWAAKVQEMRSQTVDCGEIEEIDLC